MAEDDACVVCSLDVRPRQEALQCDDCHKWQHRTCNTGVSRSFYWQLVRGGRNLSEWRCHRCSPPETSGLDDLSKTYPCVVCHTTVRERQEALQCDGCDKWQHRTCNTGLSRTFYWQLVRGEVDLSEWRCPECCTAVCIIDMASGCSSETASNCLFEPTLDLSESSSLIDMDEDSNKSTSPPRPLDESTRNSFLRSRHESDTLAMDFPTQTCKYGDISKFSFNIDQIIFPPRIPTPAKRNLFPAHT